MVLGAMAYSIPDRAQKAGIFQLEARTLREWGVDKHGNVDDTPFGGSPGMVLRVDVAHQALEAVDPNHQAIRIMLTPDGELFKQATAQELSESNKDLVLLCGRYEGFDDRISKYIDRKISIGQFVVSGGELPAMVVIDSIIRLLPGALGNEASLEQETYNNDLTDFPQFTRPVEYDGAIVPEVLRSGHHEQILQWRRDHQRKTDWQKNINQVNYIY